MADASDVRHRPARLGAIVLLICALVLAAGAAYKYIRLRPHVTSLLGRARVLQTMAGQDLNTLGSSESMGWMREELAGTREDLEAIRAETPLLLWLAEHLDWLPRVGADVAAGPALLDMAIHLCDAGWWGVLGLEPIVDTVYRTDAKSSRTALEAALPVLAVSQPRFGEAERALARASSARERLAVQALSPFLAKWTDRLDRYWPILEAATQLAQLAPKMLGQERPVTYLILMQNNHELRATGGFISGVGVIQFSQGKIITTTFQDSYAVDAGCALSLYPPAPAPLRRYMWAPALVFRDANWSPDFPSSAQVAASIYRQCTGADVDGVISIDLDGLEALLSALGPLQPEGYPEPVTGETLLKFVGEYWTDPLRSASILEMETSDWWSHRKDFMADLLQAALAQVTTQPQSIEPTKLAMATFNALEGRHFLVWLQEADAARAMATTGWDGALRPPDGDYLMIVDSNVGFRKVNPYLRQRVDYEVSLRQDKLARATLTLRYANESKGAPECIAGARYDDSYEEMMQGCYWDYVRVYVPRGTELLSIAGSDSEPEIFEEAGKTVFTAFLSVAPGQSRELVLNYQLPSTLIADWAPSTYRLLIQKQPGSADSAVQVVVSSGDWLFDPTRSDASLDTETHQVCFRLERDTRLTWARPDAKARVDLRPWAVLGLASLATILAGAVTWRRG